MHQANHHQWMCKLEVVLQRVTERAVKRLAKKEVLLFALTVRSLYLPCTPNDDHKETQTVNDTVKAVWAHVCGWLFTLLYGF